VPFGNATNCNYAVFIGSQDQEIAQPEPWSKAKQNHP